MFIELNNDQRRESINTSQRFQAYRNAVSRERGYRGSMVWEETGGHVYLARSYYDENGKRRQKSLGKQSVETIAVKEKFDSERKAAIASRKSIDEVLERQAAINRALGLGRVPITVARILRVLEKRGLLGRGLRVVGTNALFCYEAACGVSMDSGVTATEDIDLLFDARRSLRFVGDPGVTSHDLIDLLKLADRSFRPTPRRFRAENSQGFLVDLIKPQTNPPWAKSRQSVGGEKDLQASGIEGLCWLENTPSFEQTVIDEKGRPLSMVCPDPRAFAVHKYWLSNQPSRNPQKRVRDRQQAIAVAKLTKEYLLHLPLETSELRMMPLDVVNQAIEAFRNA